MKKRKAVFIALFIVIAITGIVLLGFKNDIFVTHPVSVNAEVTGGESGTDGSCGEATWCYNALGIRVSLYIYKGGSDIQYLGSADYSAYGRRTLQGRSARTTSQKAGRIAYQYGLVSGPSLGGNSSMVDQSKEITCYYGLDASGNACLNFENMLIYY